MTRVVLIRPGSTDYDEQDRIQGVLDVPLNARGAVEAAKTAEELRATPLHTIYSCSEECAQGTARAIAKASGIRVRKLNKLHNVDQGLWQGLQVDEVRRKHPRVYRQWCESPTTVCPPGGETIMDAYERARRVLRPVLRRNQGQTIGLVVPEPLASVVRCYLLQLDLARVWDARAMDGRWEVLEWVNEQTKTVEP